MSLHCRFSCTLKVLGIRPDVRAAIALSGGPDSLALAVLASRWLQRGSRVPLCCPCVPLRVVHLADADWCNVM